MFKFIETEDQSLTLRIGDAGEPMHSLVGAFSETLYIYGEALETCFAGNFPARVLSVGLGLGYNEILSAALAVKYGRELSGESFEMIPELKTHFSSWSAGERVAPRTFIQAYESFLERAANGAGASAESVKYKLGHAIQTGAWRLREALEPGSPIFPTFGCICFDAFSSKTSPELWTEDFLRAFFAQAPARACVVSTYACTGSLKRALKDAGFTVKVRAGFGPKRDSTFALRTH